MSAVPPRPLRVCCVIGALTAGGSEQQMIGILRQLDRRKFTPHLYTFYDGGELVDQVPEDVPHFCHAVDHSIPRSMLPGGITRALSRRLALYCAEHQIDLVYDRTYHVALVTGPACWRAAVPYINTIVENPEVGFSSTAGPFAWLKYWQLRRVYLKAAQVLAVSRDLSRAAERFHRLPTNSVMTCYNFIDHQRQPRLDLAHDRRTAREPSTDRIRNRPSNQLRMIAVGRLHWQKGLDVLLKALAAARAQSNIDWRLDLVGLGPQEQQLRQWASELGLEAVVDFRGWIADPAPLVADADLFVLPSLAEGLPNSLLEALLIGTPAIASDCRFGPAELTDQGRWASLVPPGDVQQWTDALLAFARDPGPALERAATAATVLRTRFAAETGCHHLEQCMLDVVQNR